MFCLKRFCVLNQKLPWKYYFPKSKRPLYSSSSLGIDSFLVQREKTFTGIKDLNGFKQQLRQICEKNKILVFLNDIRKMIGIAQCDDDIKLLFSLIRKYSNQKEALVFEGYRFGPEVMRLLHVMNKPDEAVALVEDKDLFSYFQHYNTVLVLLDLLFKNNRHEEVVKLYEYYKNNVDFGFIPSGLILIFLASCYKLNTPECFEKAFEAHKMGFLSGRPPLRNSLFFAALAVKQNKPICVIETFANTTRFNNLVENLKYMAYAQARRTEEVFASISSIFCGEHVKQFFIVNEVVSFIEEEIKKDIFSEHTVKFQSLKEELIKKDLIIDKPLDTFLCCEVELKKNFPLKTKLLTSEECVN